MGDQQQGKGTAEVDSTSRCGGGDQETGFGEGEEARGGGAEAVPGAGVRPGGGEAK